MAEIYQRAGSAVYQARIKIDGNVKRVSTGRKCPRDAQEEADRLEAEARAALILPSDICLIAATDRYIRDHPKKLAPRTVGNYHRNLANVIEYLGDFPLRLLTEEKVQEYIEWKLERSGHVMVRRDLSFLSAVMTRARQWKCGVKDNPVALIDKRGILEADRRTTHLRPVDVQKLIDACTKEDHKRFIILAVNTGMRHQELLKLHWDEINLKERTVYLGGHRTKNSCSREIALSNAAMSTLLSTPEHTRHGYVFKGRNEGEAMFQMGKRWASIRKRAGLPDVRIHDLRHTFASWLKQRGVAETTIMDMMGHKTRDMVRRYSHDNTDSRRAAVSVLDLNTVSNTGATDKQGAHAR